MKTNFKTALKTATLGILLSACGTPQHISSNVTDFGECSVVAETATIQELDCGSGLMLITKTDDGVKVVYTGTEQQ